MRLLLSLAAIAASLTLSACQQPPDGADFVEFEDVTDLAGILQMPVKSYGVAWGDANDDGWPDLWLSNHYCTSPFLYLNNGDGTFRALGVKEFDPGNTGGIDLANAHSSATHGLKNPRLGDQDKWCGDFHGAAWADFDNDGDQDLVQLAGGGRDTDKIDFRQANRLLVNQGGVFIDRAAELGLDLPPARGRAPLWFDADRDGRLDLLPNANKRSDGEGAPTVFLQRAAGFEATPPLTSHGIQRSSFALLLDLADPHTQRLLLFGTNRKSQMLAFQAGSGKARMLKGPFNGLKAEDAAAADLSGNAAVDLYMVTGASREHYRQLQPGVIQGWIPRLQSGSGLSFGAPGDFRLIIDKPFGRHVGMVVRGGASGTTLWPPATGKNSDLSFSNEDGRTHGFPSPTSQSHNRIDIGYDPDSRRWRLEVFRGPGEGGVRFRLESSGTFAEPKPIGEAGRPPEPSPAAISVPARAPGDPGRTISKGPGVSVVAGDFDNDMKVDLYVVNSSLVGNLPNVLYRNTGTGTLEKIESAGAAVGATDGIGDSVTVVDYDRDGFLDLLIADSGGPPIFSTARQYQLLRNRGNDNHWLAIDLRGTDSNRDGTGAAVYLTAGGITQLRERHNGVHGKVQDHGRLHFGLGRHERVDAVEVRWPSGTVQRLADLPADRLILIEESTQPVYTVIDD